MSGATQDEKEAAKAKAAAKKRAKAAAHRWARHVWSCTEQFSEATRGLAFAIVDQAYVVDEHYAELFRVPEHTVVCASKQIRLASGDDDFIATTVATLVEEGILARVAKSLTRNGGRRFLSSCGPHALATAVLIELGVIERPESEARA